MKLQICQQILEKKRFKNKISWKSVQWESSYAMRIDGRTDGRDETNDRFSQFRERA